MKSPLYILSLVTLLCLTSCNGIMGGIYDEADFEGDSSFGFVDASTPTRPGKVYIDATSYTDWVYIDFATMKTLTLDVDAPEPEHWDIAVHRYDAKTNRAEVASTDCSDFDRAFYSDPKDYIADVWTTNTIITDMSTMMDGYLGYVDSFFNPELSSWLDVDKSTMPPIYTLSDKVYIVRLSDKRNIAVKLTDFMNSEGVKGYLTIEYIYPFDLK